MQLRVLGITIRQKKERKRGALVKLCTRPLYFPLKSLTVYQQLLGTPVGPEPIISTSTSRLEDPEPKTDAIVVPINVM
jgi:hypothetical protein